MSVIDCNNVHYWDSLLINTKRNINNCLQLLRYINISISAVENTRRYIIYACIITLFQF